MNENIVIVVNFGFIKGSIILWKIFSFFVLFKCVEFVKLEW